MKSDKKILAGKVKQAVILAGGVNSRMLPISKIIPKIMLPLGRKLAIEYLIEECLNSGISYIYIVVGGKDSLIEKYFKPNLEIATCLQKRNKIEALKRLEEIESLSKYLKFIIQDNPQGEADALISFVEKCNYSGPLAVLLGDMVIDQNKMPVLKQLLNKPVDGKHLLLSDGRLVLTKKGIELCKERYGINKRLDIRIMDLFKNSEKVFYDVEGREIKLGSLEDYEKNFSL